MKDPTLNLDFVGYRIICKPWSSVRAIMAEFHPNPDILRQALQVGHGITIDESIPGHDPMLFFIFDSEIAEKLADFRIPNPTMMQIMGTSRVIALTKEDAVAKFEALMRGEDLPNSAKV